MTFLFGLLFIVCMSVSGTLHARKHHGFSLFAMFWAGYNFNIFARMMFAS